MLRAKTTFEGMARTSVEAYFHSVSLMRGPMRAQLFSDAFKRALAATTRSEVFDRHAARHAELSGSDDPLALIQYLDLKTYLVGDINTKVDRASMAHSLEVREPLMDHPLVEWLATLPSSLKVRGNEGKFLLKKAMEPHAAARRAVPAQDGLRGAAGALVPRAAEAARARRRAGRAAGRHRLVQPRLEHLQHLVDEAFTRRRHPAATYSFAARGRC
jgi:asparagine synthetase B (glutamine-hydrolysing)